MKICVLVPSEAYRQNAGARIRYGRLTEALASHSAELQIAEIGQFNPITSGADVLLISKCHDARAQLVAIEARRRGIRVGVDLFDDYFSQNHDARLARFRRWLADLAPWLSFALTSTRAMADVASDYLGDTPVLVVNDPAAFGSASEMSVASAEDIEAKRTRALDEDLLRIAWFGIGDNPYFAVGLSDIAAFGTELAMLARLSRMAVKLTILTNARSLTAEGLARIADLPVSVEIQEWSEEAEATLLQDSFACFVPVNAQAFSAAKSLNRAITALTAGCQLLSAGFPLYAPLDRFLYRDVRALVADLESNGLRVSAGRRNELIAGLDRSANPNVEAEALVTFLASLPIPARSPADKVALVHGANSNDATNKVARAMGDITVGSPYAPSNLDVDAWARVRLPLTIDLFISDPLGQVFRSGAASPNGPEDHGKKRFMDVTTPNESFDLGGTLDLSSAALGVQVALYGSVMAQIRDRLSTDLGINQITWSENSVLPFSLAH